MPTTKPNNMEKTDECPWCGQSVYSDGTADITATAIMLQRDAENRSRMDYLMAKALLTGKIESRVVSWAEQLVYVYEKMMEETKHD